MSSQSVKDDEDNLGLLYCEIEEVNPEGDREISLPFPITVKVEPMEDNAEYSDTEGVSLKTCISQPTQSVSLEKENHQLDTENSQHRANGTKNTKAEHVEKSIVPFINETLQQTSLQKESSTNPNFEDIEVNKSLENMLNENETDNDQDNVPLAYLKNIALETTEPSDKGQSNNTKQSEYSEDINDEDVEVNECTKNNDGEQETIQYLAEYLDENAIKKELLDLPEEYEVEFLEDELLDDTNINNENILPEHHHKTYKRRRRYKKDGYISVVEQLREEYPELRKDKEKLVKELAAIMRQAKPPPPPDNFYTIVVESEYKVAYECSFCGKWRRTLPLAARHYQFSHGENYLTCLACGVKHRNTTNLYKHEKTCIAPDAALVLRARGRYLGRKGRGRPFTTQDKFVTCNSRQGPPEKGQRLYCSKCPASFAHRENLEAHEYSHEGVRPFHCGHCPARYTSAPALRRHFLAMHGDQQFICDHCGASFKLKPLLVSHMNSHRAVRKYPCLYCERRFTQKNALRHHMNKVHLNLPPAHGCPLCPKRYPRMTQVKDHMLIKHGLTMITRRMYYQSLPNLPQDAFQVTLEPSIVNYKLVSDMTPAVKHYIKPIPKYEEKNTPHVKEEQDELLADWPLQEYVELDLRDNKPNDPFISYVVVKDGKTTRVNTGIKEVDFLKKILGDEEQHNQDNEEAMDEDQESIENVVLYVENEEQTVNSEFDDEEQENGENEQEDEDCVENEQQESVEYISDEHAKIKKSPVKKRQASPSKEDTYVNNEIELTDEGVKKVKKSGNDNACEEEIETIQDDTYEAQETPVEEIVQNVEHVILQKQTVDTNMEQEKSNPSVNTELEPAMKVSPENEKDWEQYNKTIVEKDEVVAKVLEDMRSKSVPSVSVPVLRKEKHQSGEGPSQCEKRTQEKTVGPDSDEEEFRGFEGSSMMPEIV